MATEGLARICHVHTPDLRPVVHMQPAQKRITGKGKKAEQAVPSAREDLKMVSVSLYGFLASAWRPSLRQCQCLTCRCCVSTESLRWGPERLVGAQLVCLGLTYACVPFMAHA